MQRYSHNYDPATMKRWTALVLPQPYASAMCERGAHVELVSAPTDYRGEVLVCSTHAPHYPHLCCGTTVGMAELVDCRPVQDMNPDDWRLTRVRRGKWGSIKKGYALYFTDARRVIEIPCTAKRGLRELVYDNDDITEYPRQVVIDDKAWRKMHKKNGRV